MELLANVPLMSAPAGAPGVASVLTSDEEDDEARDPSYHLIHMHDLISEASDEERSSSNDDNARP